MGRLVADVGKRGWDELTAEYGAQLMEGLVVDFAVEWMKQNRDLSAKSLRRKREGVVKVVEVDTAIDSLALNSEYGYNA